MVRKNLRLASFMGEKRSRDKTCGAVENAEEGEWKRLLSARLTATVRAQHTAHVVLGIVAGEDGAAVVRQFRDQRQAETDDGGSALRSVRRSCSGYRTMPRVCYLRPDLFASSRGWVRGRWGLVA